jgi:hypothetical protein
MVETWVAAGQPVAHFLLATLPPVVLPEGNTFPIINEGMRALAAETGISIIDLAAHTSDDDGLTWKAPDYHVGDELHYSEQVRDWIAAEVFARMNERIPEPTPSRNLAHR